MTPMPPSPPPQAAEPLPPAGAQPVDPARSWEDADLPTLNRLVRELLRQYTGPPPDPPRGLLPTPPVVAALMAREARKHPMTPEARQRLTNHFNLQYFYGGQEIAYRNTPDGVEVLAVGLDEVGALAQGSSQDQLDHIVFTQPESWL
jgi:transglutaminase-like putative cysteine protease